jgi:uridylate kinase
MADISAELVKELRDRTGAGFMDCKKALSEAGGDLDKATSILRERGLAAAAKKSSREAREGLVSSYIHTGGRVGVLIEVNCETDFVARTDEFQKLVKDLAVQVAGLAPLYVDRESIPPGRARSEKAELLADEATRRKPENIREQIVTGQLDKWYARSACSTSRSGTRSARSRADHRPDRDDRREHRVAGSPATRSGRSCERRATARSPTDRRPLRRILLKLSGEALLGDRPYGVDPAFCAFIAEQVEHGPSAGRPGRHRRRRRQHLPGLAAAARGMDRATGDYIGMLATVMNGLALQDALETVGVPTAVMTAIAMNEVAEPYIRRRGHPPPREGPRRHLRGGTGNPYFTTDTAAALRAVEINAEVLLKATKVDGVYDKDPMTNDGAQRYARLDYADLLRDQLKVMDAAAVSLCDGERAPDRRVRPQPARQHHEGRDRGAGRDAHLERRSSA